MSMVLSHRTALELYRSSMMPVSGYEKVSFLSLSVPTRNDVECYRALPIRTSHIDFRVSAVFKIENTTMLQKFPYNRTDMNILTDSRHSYFQTADTPYQKLHLNSAGRCTIQSCNNLRITEVIHLCTDQRRKSFLRILCLTFDQA